MSADAPTPLDLDAIETAISACRTYNFGIYQADRLAHEHAPALVEEVKRLRAALDGVGEALDSAQSDVMAQALTASRAVAKAREKASRRKAERDEARAEVARLREGAQVLRGWIAEHEETIVETSDALDEARRATRPAPAWDEVAVKGALIDAQLASVRRIMNDGYPSTFIRSNEDAADAALAVVRDHLPVKPDREAIVRAMHAEVCCPCDPTGCDVAEVSENRYADAVLDLWPGRSEAEVKAEALREAADWLAHMDDGRDTGQHRAGRDIIARLRDRADRLAAEGGAS